MTRLSSPGSLRRALAEVMLQRPEWYRALLAEVAEHSKATALAGALKVGEVMPPFVLPNSDGALISFGQLIARGPLVINFVRGGWCPFCNATLTAFNAVLSELANVGGHMVALTPDASGNASIAKRDLGLHFDLLTDIDCAVGLNFGVVYRVPDKYRDALKRLGVDLVERFGDGPGLLPMPSTFLVGSDGRVRFAHVSGDVTDRAEPATLVRLIEERRRAGNSQGLAD